MSYTFNGTTQYLSRADNLGLTNENITMACWWNASAVTAAMTIMALGNNGASGFWRLALDGATANDPLLAQKQDDSANIAASSINTSASTGVWYHGAAVFASDTSRTAYFNGTAATTNTSLVLDPTVDFASIGALRRSTVASFFAGSIADAAFWNVSLSATDIAALAKGVSPLNIRPDALISYVPLIRENIDWVGTAWTATASPTISAHPRVMLPKRSFMRRFTTASGGGGSAFPWHHYQMMRRAA